MTNGKLEYAVDGYDVTTKDCLLKLSLRQVPLSDNLNLRRITTLGFDNALRTPFLMDQYLLERGDERVADWPSFVANSKWFAEPLRTGSEMSRWSTGRTSARRKGSTASRWSPRRG